MTAERVDRADALDLIRSNIERSGYHIYLVAQGTVPRFAYTIGLTDLSGSEIVLAGAIHYMAEDVRLIFRVISDGLRSDPLRTRFSIQGLGTFTLRTAHESWTSLLLLGALDYYQERKVSALQIAPDEAHWTRDIPDLTRPWGASTEPVWQWLCESWTYPVPSDSTVVTNLDALRGEPIREVARWEPDQWEMFTGPGPQFSEEQVRVVSLGTMLAIDPSLLPAIELDIGDGLFRADAGDRWQEWN